MLRDAIFRLRLDDTKLLYNQILTSHILSLSYRIARKIIHRYEWIHFSWLPVPRRFEWFWISFAAAGQVRAAFTCCCQATQASESVWTVQTHAGALSGFCYLVGSGCDKVKLHRDIM
ncbi:unnamed protein product [Meganyctiphanes norvegica]|uniref:Uncharacterized protein n=1 Tax=Meganyctiphanes norvegica TaxID=48144 RepID=A0AAV2PYR6_MEGNR